MKFRTQIVDGKPQIFFENFDDSKKKTRTKRNSRSIQNSQSFRHVDQKLNNDQRPSQPNKIREDGSNMGVYMTMDELSELVKAVKENAKKEIEPTPTAPPTTFVQPVQYQEPLPPPVVPKLELPANEPIVQQNRVSPREHALSIMAEKKRQKWQRERAEVERLQMEIQYDQLKHQLSPKHNKSSVSPERSTFQYDFPTNGKPPPGPIVPPSLRNNDNPVEATSRMDGELVNRDQAKTRLMEKKQQQWKQEKTEKTTDWNPFGRPGGGAPNPIEMTARPTPAPTLVPPVTYVHNDQSRVPAAMRTNLGFGDVRTEDDVKTVKELERRQWLEDLQKQIDENKRKKIMGYENDRRKEFLHENVQPLLQEAANRHNPNVRPTGNYSNGQDNVSNYDGRSTAVPGNQRSGEKLFGPNYETSNTNNHLDLLQMNGVLDTKHQYRLNDPRRDEAAVNTVVTTFRSDQPNGNDYRKSSEKHKQKQTQNGHAYEDSDLPPYGSRSNTRTTKTKQNNYQFDGTTYQLNGQRQLPINERPLWNYKNPSNRGYVSNSKRDPHYEKRQRLKHFEQGNFDRIDDVQKKVCYNRWNSDSELQQNQKQNKTQSKNRIRSTNSKATGFGGSRKDESILNLLKSHQRQQEVHGMRKPSSIPVRNDDDYQSNRASSPDKDEQFSLYQHGDDHQDFSPRPQSRDSSPQKFNLENPPYDNPTRGDPLPPPPPASRQDHILQQLSTIRENLIRRQRELAT